LALVRHGYSRLLFAFCLSFLPAAAHAGDFLQPTPQELSMTSEPAAPDAAAVFLYREEIADDHLHMHSVYVRLKILTEEGKKYADVEIPYERRRFSIAAVEGRTIHSDGTSVPFTGKPYDKMLVKTATLHYQAKVFSMPDVQVGSILEYRYQLRYEDNVLLPPTWFIQGELYLRKAHYKYVPTPRFFNTIITTGRNQTASSLIWYPILPKGDVVKHYVPPTTGASGQLSDSYDLDVDNIPPEPREEYIPPLHSLTYRVYFIYSAYDNATEFWNKEGKFWSKQVDKFIGPGPAVSAVVSKVTSPGDSPDLKLQKLYVEVMSYENTDFTRQRSSEEEKAAGLRETKTTDDIVTRKRGSSEELTMVFIAMARAAGMKAYYMQATSREDAIFNQNLLSMNQLDSPIAIVNVAGKDQFFDPGERYCAYNHLRWDHSTVSGLRQTDGGTAIGQTPPENYNDSKTVRIAKLTLADNGDVDGVVQIGYTGDPALQWRQRALKQDQAEVEKEMEDATRRMLPGGLTVKLERVYALADSSKQLVANFRVQGPLGNVTSKRLFVPIEIFEANEKPLFTQPKRETPVYFHFGYQNVDQVSLTYPPSDEIESAPQQDEVKMQTAAILREGSETKGNTVTLTRNFGMASVIFPVADYGELRTFFGKVNHKDQEQLVLKVAGHADGN
jgi:hypothetical protein